MSELGDKQDLLTVLLPKLLEKIHVEGFACSLGDAYRDPRLFGNIGETKGYGHAKSCHKLRLAVDINLKKDGKFLTNTEDHKQFGEFWESLHPMARWGGHFTDGNHYSITYNCMVWRMLRHSTNYSRAE